MIDNCYIGGHLWALPYYDASSYMCLYNKTLFDEMGLQAPQTWDELVSVSKALSEKDGVMPMIFQGKDGWAWPMMYTEIYNQTTGNKSVAAVQSFLKGESSFVSDASVQAFDLVKKFYDENVLTQASLDTDDETKFLNSQIAGNSSEYLDWLWPSEVNDALSTAIVSVISGEMSSQDAAQYVQDAYTKVCEEKDYTYAWWESWTQEQWDAVTPTKIPDLTQYMQ